MAPPLPLYRGQGNGPFDTARPVSAAKRGQTVPYDINGKPQGPITAALADGAYGDVTVSGSGTVFTVLKAAKLTTARSITASGDASWSVTFDGSANVTAALTLATVNGAPGTFGSASQSLTATVDAKGRITALSAQTIAAAWASITGKPTTLAGYGITDAQGLSTLLTAYAGQNWAAGVQIPTLTAANTVALKTVGSATGNILDKASGDALYLAIGGTATAATKLATARNINGVAFDGTAAITINAVDSTARVPATRLISTTAPLAGGGDLSADRTLSITAASGVAAGSMSASDFTKLSGVATGATANSTDAFLLSRANHTGTQAGSTVTGTFITSGMTMTTARLLGRTTAASGAAEEISVGSGLSLVAGVISATGGSGTVTSVSGTANEIGVVTGTTTPVLSLPAALTFTGKTITGGTFSTPTLTTPVINGLPTGTGVAATSTASVLVARDANKNILANNFLADYTTTATAAGTTTLTVASTYLQFFTGTTTQTITLPVASTLALGQQFQIVNNSTGAVTVNSSGGNVVIVLAGSTAATLTCILTSGTTAASWSASYWAVAVTTAKSLTVSNTLTLTGTDGSSVAFGTGGTVLYSGGALGTPSSGTLTNCTFPTLNQNTTGSAAKLTTPRTIAGNSFDGTANIPINDTDLSGAAWTAYTPVVTAATGAITTASATGRFKQIGKTVFVQMTITITTNGTGSQAVWGTLPVTASTNGEYMLMGRSPTTGKMLQGDIASGSNTKAFIVNYDNTYPAASGTTLALTGCYEAA